MSRQNKETKKITNTQSTALKNKKPPKQKHKKQIPASKKTNESADKNHHTPRNVFAAFFSCNPLNSNAFLTKVLFPRKSKKIYLFLRYTIVYGAHKRITA